MKRALDGPIPEKIAPALLEWAAQHGRHHLPWQTEPSPYRVWISEVMLQQTQVATVLPYYQRFMARFPNVAALAAAPLDEVLHAWSGLGYYARARNLHRAAQIVTQLHDGRVPTDFHDLKALPGIGRSTAGAILALSCSQRHPILDGNARRVLARVFGVEGDPIGSETQARLWALAEACTPHEHIAEYTQAIMDLGASVCARSRPDCDACPLSHCCVAQHEGRQHELPSPRVRHVRPQRSACALVVLDHHGAVLLEQRPAGGLWGGLWSFPMFDTEAEAMQWLAVALPAGSVEPRSLSPQQHAFTHFDLALRLVVTPIGAQAKSTEHGYAWYDPNNPPLLGISKAVLRFLSCSQ